MTKMKRLGAAIAVLVAMLCATAPAGAYTQGSAYRWDGHWWGDCNGTTQVASRSRTNSLNGTAKLQIFYCSQGYYFARGSTTKRSGILVELWRDNPYRLDMQSATAYAVMTNGVARRGHTCYHAWFSPVGQLNICN